MSKQLAVIDTERAGETGARRSRAARAGRRSAARALRGTWDLLRCCAIFRRPASTAAAAAERFRGARIARGAEKISERDSARRRNRRVADARRGRTRRRKVSARGSPRSKFRRRRAFRARRGSTQRAKCSPRSANFCAIPRGRKSCTIQSSSSCSRARSPESAMRRCCIPTCCVPPPRSTALADAVLRQENVTLSGAPGERADHLQRLAPLLRKEVEAQGLAELYETIDLPLAPVLAAMERHGVRVDRESACRHVRDDGARNPRARKNDLGTGRIGIQRQFAAAARRNSVRQDGPDARRKAPRESRARLPRTCSKSWRSLHEIAAQSPRIPRNQQAQIHVRGRAAETDSRRNRPPAHQLQPDRRGHGAPQLLGPEPAEYSRALGTGPRRFAPRSSPGPATRCFPPIIRRSSCAFSRISRRIPCWSKRSAPGRTFTRAPRRKFSASAPWRKTPSTAARPKPSTSASSTGKRRSVLRRSSSIDQKEAAQFIAAYFARYRGVKEYLERSLAEARKTGVTRTLFGRIRPVPEITSPQVEPAQFRGTHRSQHAAAGHRRRPDQARHDRDCTASSRKKNFKPR